VLALDAAAAFFLGGIALYRVEDGEAKDIDAKEKNSNLGSPVEHTLIFMLPGKQRTY
jgi:hypothetical protein